jgi:hypothetical protein
MYVDPQWYGRQTYMCSGGVCILPLMIAGCFEMCACYGGGGGRSAAVAAATVVLLQQSAGCRGAPPAGGVTAAASTDLVVLESGN